MSKPVLLMLDEPSLGLAPQIVEELFEILVKINDQNISILLVEQNVDFALRIADRAYILEHGNMTREGSAAELRASDEVRAAYSWYLKDRDELTCSKTFNTPNDSDRPMAPSV